MPPLDGKKPVATMEKKESKDAAVQEEQKKPIRYIFSLNTSDGGAVNTFKNTATLLEKEYKARDNEKTRIQKKHISESQEIIDYIHSQAEGFILSIDIIGHGSSIFVGIMDKNGARASLVTDLEKYKAASARNQSIPSPYTPLTPAEIAAGLPSQTGPQIQAVTRIFAEMTAGLQGEDLSKVRELADIQYVNFANNAKIEIHGCNTASGGSEGESFARELSLYLYNAGKKKSYVIGHERSLGPQSNDDYRHQRRIIYHNGKPVQYDGKNDVTFKKGHLDEQKIEGQIEKQLPASTK